MITRARYSDRLVITRARYSDIMVITRVRNCAGERRLSYVGLRKFNNLPGEVWKAETMTGFKRALMSTLGDD